MKIQLFFSYINLGNDPKCSNTALSLFLGTSASGIPALIRCGNHTTSVSSDSNVMTLKYSTNVTSSMLPADHGFIIYFAMGRLQGKSRKYVSQG